LARRDKHIAAREGFGILRTWLFSFLARSLQIGRLWTVNVKGGEKKIWLQTSESAARSRMRLDKDLDPGSLIFP
jgi:hypothetical protein